MPSAEPYLFNRTFDTASCNDADARATTADVAAAEPTYSAADLERARAEGIAFGRAEALAVIEDQRACERLRQATLTAIAERLGEVSAKSAESSEQAGRDGVTIAAAIARKLLPRLYREHARSEIESLVESVLTRVGVEPLVTVRLSPTLLAELVPALEAAAAAHDHQRHLRIKGDPEVAEGDCLLEWSGGGTIRDYALLWREIDAATAQAAGVGTPAGDPPSPTSPKGEHHV